MDQGIVPAVELQAVLGALETRLTREPVNEIIIALGTDGLGRSDTRPALRDFFEVDAKHIVLATLVAMARRQQVPGR